MIIIEFLLGLIAIYVLGLTSWGIILTGHSDILVTLIAGYLVLRAVAKWRNRVRPIPRTRRPFSMPDDDLPA